MRGVLRALLAPLALLASGLFVFSVAWVTLGGVSDTVYGFAWLLMGIAAVVAAVFWILAWRFRRPILGEVGSSVGERTRRKKAGFTYRRNLTRRGWYRPLLVRIILVVFGVIVLFAGSVLWSLEEEYGGDPDRQEYVIGWDDLIGGHVVLGEGGEVVYEATDFADAEAWVEAQRGARNFIYSFVVLAFGALLIFAGVAPSPARREPALPPPSKIGVGA